MMSSMLWKILVIFLSLMTARSLSDDMEWDHNVELDENFCLFWKVKDSDIIFEMQVKTLGYVGLGFARSEYIYGADMVIGWVDNKHTFFQVSISTQKKTL
jgi:hypothetical protein